MAGAPLLSRRAACRAAPRNPTSMPQAALLSRQASAMLDLAELLVRRGVNSTTANEADDGGVAGACDLAAAAAMLEPGARSEEAVREHCGAAAAGASAAAVTADTRGGGACAMLVPFPALAAHSKVDDDGACLVTLPAGNTRLGGPPGQQRAQPAQGVIVPRGASLRVVGARRCRLGSRRRRRGPPLSRRQWLAHPREGPSGILLHGRAQWCPCQVRTRVLAGGAREWPRAPFVWRRGPTSAQRNAPRKGNRIRAQPRGARLGRRRHVPRRRVCRSRRRSLREQCRDAQRRRNRDRRATWRTADRATTPRTALDE